MANTYTFLRRVIYWEEEIVEANTVDEAYEKVGNGEAVEVHILDFYDYYDEDYEFVEEQINDPLVKMVLDYDHKKQLELFE